MYEDIAKRTKGEVYLGVVGPVRTGKSTFIRKFSENVMLPNIEDEYTREMAKDEMPQSGTGKTVTTTEPKFVPGSAVKVTFKNNVNAKLRLIDCVGYMIPGAIGNMEGEIPRLVSTPWNEEPIPFAEAAEIGTRKVIKEHSTIGILVTTDGSITDIGRDNYIMAEERVVKELKEINKPFVIILNTTHPLNENTTALAAQLKEKYDVPVQILDCMNLKTEDIENVLENVLYEFPIKEINVDLPRWFDGLTSDYSLKRDLIDTLQKDFKDYYKLSDFNAENIFSAENDYVEEYYVKDIELGTGCINMKIDLDNSYYYKVISELSGEEITGEHQILKLIGDLSKAKNKYSCVEAAINDAKTKGYGYVTPGISDMIIEKPEVFKEGSRYGIKIKAQAPSLHIFNASLNTEVSPVIGSKAQSEDLINHLVEQMKDNPQCIWEAEIFGKTIYNLVEEQLESKLTAMPENARKKLKKTIEKIVNDGSGSIIFLII
ncbi:MAG: stage IV sporulation protein A [Sedimentibacter sp.]